MQSKLEQLYDRYRGRLMAYASRFLSSEEEAEDVVQDVFLYISEKPGKIGRVDSAETYHYLSVIVKHKALDRLREMKSFVQDDFLLEEEQAVCEISEETALSAALRQMPERTREMLLMRYADGVSTREIARLYGMKPDSVRRALHRAKTELKRQLSEQ